MDAATIAACVQLQSSDAFWRLSDNLFKNQSSITTETLRPLVDTWLLNDSSVDEAKLSDCIASGQGKKLVDRDVALGKSVGVKATPTSFVNGVILEGASTEDKLMDLIHSAEVKLASSKPSVNGPGGAAIAESGVMH
jgi:protein-disulfide isomerase